MSVATRRSSQQELLLSLIQLGGPSTIGQLVWARLNPVEAKELAASGRRLPAATASSDRSAYSSTHRALEKLVADGSLTKLEGPDSGQWLFAVAPATHSYKTMALSSLAQAKLERSHYEQLVQQGASSLAVLDAIGAATSWNPGKTKLAVESIADVLGMEKAEAVNPPAQNDQLWEEFLRKPMRELVDEAGLADPAPMVVQQTPPERRRLAAAIVGLLGLLVCVGIGVALLRPNSLSTVAADGGGTSPQCEPIDLRNAAAIPASTPCANGTIEAVGDLDANWNGILSGWDVPEGHEIYGVWENWEDGTPDPSGVEQWTGSGAHRDTDPQDDRYQEIRVVTPASGQFTIYENRGLTGRSVTFTYRPDTDETAEQSSLPEAQPGPTELSIPEEGRRSVSDAGGMSVLWDGQFDDNEVVVPWGDPTTSQTVLAASLIADEVKLASVSGQLTLDPGDQPDGDPFSGGLYIRFYANDEIGSAGGQSAQLGMVNTRMGPIVDRSSGICPHSNCVVSDSGEYVTAPSVDLDASAGLGFVVEVVEGEMTMTLTSIADPEQEAAVVTMPFDGGIGAVAIELWGTEWPFLATVDDFEVGYEDGAES